MDEPVGAQVSAGGAPIEGACGAAATTTTTPSISAVADTAAGLIADRVAVVPMPPAGRTFVVVDYGMECPLRQPRLVARCRRPRRAARAAPGVGGLVLRAGRAGRLGARREVVLGRPLAADAAPVPGEFYFCEAAGRPAPPWRRGPTPTGRRSSPRGRPTWRRAGVRWSRWSGPTRSRAASPPGACCARCGKSRGRWPTRAPWTPAPSTATAGLHAHPGEARAPLERVVRRRRTPWPTTTTRA